MLDNYIVKRLESPETLLESYRLRYQVYCEQKHYIREELCPAGLECDDFDKNAVHFGVFRKSGLMVGTTRLILPTARSFPMEKHASSVFSCLKSFERSQSAEVSRLTVAACEKGDDPFALRNSVILGLCLAFYDECRRRRLRFCFALFERTFWMLAKMFGFSFQPIGPETGFSDRVRPYVLDVASLHDEHFDRFLDNKRNEFYFS